MDDDYGEAVLDAVAQIPAGRVATYGQIAQLVGDALSRGGPRMVGQVMAQRGGAVPWWRVVNAAGQPPKAHAEEALRRLREEHCALSAAATRVDMRLARWDGATYTPPQGTASGPLH